MKRLQSKHKTEADLLSSTASGTFENNSTLSEAEV